FTQGPSEHWHDAGRHGPHSHFRKSKLRVLIGERHVAGKRESRTRTERTAANRADDGLHQGTHGEVNTTQSLGLVPLRLAWLVDELVHRVQIGARAKVVARAGEVDDTHLVVSLEMLKAGEQQLGHFTVDDVLFLGLRERDASNDTTPLDANAGHARACGSAKRRASSSGTSMNMRRSA